MAAAWYLGDDLSPGRVVHDQAISRAEHLKRQRGAYDPPQQQHPASPSVLLSTVRDILPNLSSQRESDQVFHRVVQPLPVDPSIVVDPIAPAMPQVDEELAWWGSRVIWSKGAAVFRSFTFDHENENVSKAMFAWFQDASDEAGTAGPVADAGPSSRRGLQATSSRPRHMSGQSIPDTFGPFATSYGATWTKRTDVAADVQHTSADSLHGAGQPRLQRCLVIFLQSIAHFYFSSGETSTINLPRPVEAAWALRSGGIVVQLAAEGASRLKAKPSRKGKERADETALNIERTIEDITEKIAQRSAETNFHPGSLCTISHPRDRFRPIHVARHLSVTRPRSSRGGLIAEVAEYDDVHEFSQDHRVLYVSTNESEGIMVAHDLDRQQLVFYRYAQRPTGTLLDDMPSDGPADVLQSVPDPANRDIRAGLGTETPSLRTGGRRSVGATQDRRRSEAQQGRYPSSVGTNSPTRRSSARRGTQPSTSGAGSRSSQSRAGSRLKVLTQVTENDVMDTTMTLGLSTSESWLSLSSKVICEQVYTWRIASSHGESPTAIKVFASEISTTGSLQINVHVTSPTQSALYTFSVGVCEAGARLAHDVKPLEVYPCLSACPVASTRPCVSDVAFLKADRRTLGILTSNGRVIDLALPQECCFPSGGHAPTSLEHESGSSISVVFTDGSAQRIDVNLLPESRLMTQVMMALASTLGEADFFIVKTMLAYSPSPRGNDESENLELLVSNLLQEDRLQPPPRDEDEFAEFRSFLREIEEPIDPRGDVPSDRPTHRWVSSQADARIRADLVSAVLSSLHWVAQDCMLDTGRMADLGSLVPSMCRLAGKLGLRDWVDYWWRIFPDFVPDGLSIAPSGHSSLPLMPAPPDFLSMVIRALSAGDVSVLESCTTIAKSWEASEDFGSAESYPAVQFVIRLTSVLANDTSSGRTAVSRSEDLVNMLSRDRSFSRRLRALPWALTLPITEAIRAVKNHAKPDMSPAALKLVDRLDLIAQRYQGGGKVHVDQTSSEHREVLASRRLPTIDEARAENADRALGRSEEEHGALQDYQIQKPPTPLPNFRFGVDRRLEDVQRLLQTNRPRPIKADAKSDSTDAQRSEHEEKVVVHHAQRALSRLLGQALLTFASQEVSRTARFTVPPLELAVRIMPSMDIRLPPYAKIQSEMLGWPSFHNGAAAGLSIMPGCTSIDSSWIAFNQSPIATSEHGGFLLGLGLNGHLRSLQRDHFFVYMNHRHDQTSVGLLLGMAASFAGSASDSIGALVSSNLPSMLPQGAVELNTSSIVQSAALMSLGLLYAGSGRARVAETTLNEIGRQLLSGIEPLSELREAYSFSAACAFGLVMLGRGGKNAVLDGHCVARLRAFSDSSQAVGGGGGFADGIDHDITAPGATLALGLMFLKTGRSDISALIPLPEDIFGLDQVRPDILLVRTLSRALIHWQQVEPNVSWLESQIPPFILAAWKNRSKAPIADTVELAYINIMAGACLALAIRYAGTLHDSAYKTLLQQTKAFSESHGSAMTYEAKIRRSSMKQAQYLVAISLALVVAGSGDLNAYRRIRFYLGNEIGTFAWRTALNMAAGLLFLGTGRYTFGSSNVAVAAMCIAFFPRFTSSTDDNSAYLQAYRHLWALAVEPRCIVTAEIGSLRTVYMPLKVDAIEGQATKSKSQISPALLSTFDTLSSVSVGSPRYHPSTLNIGTSASSNSLVHSQVLFVKRKAAYLDYIVDPKGHRTLNMLAGPLFNNSVEGIFGWFGGTCPISPDIHDLVGLVEEHTKQPFVNGLAQRLSALHLEDGRAESIQGRGESDQDLDDWTWSKIILKSLLLDRLESLPMELGMVLSADLTSTRVGPYNLKLLQFARDYYGPDVFVTRYSYEGSRAPDPVLKQAFINSMLATSKRKLTRSRKKELASLAQAYFQGGLDPKALPEPIQLELALYLGLYNVPAMDKLRELQQHLELADRQMQMRPDMTKDTRNQVLRWMARKAVGDMAGQMQSASASLSSKVGLLEKSWDDTSLLSALRVWLA